MNYRRQSGIRISAVQDTLIDITWSTVC